MSSSPTEESLYLGSLFGDEVPPAPTLSSLFSPRNYRNVSSSPSSSPSPSSQSPSLDSHTLPPPSPFTSMPVPLLKRQFSFSQNTISALENRLLELKWEEMNANQIYEREISKLNSLMSAIKIQFEENEKRIKNERKAVDESLEKAKSFIHSPKNEEKVEETMCSLCLERPRDSALIPCGHIAMCNECANNVYKASRECVVCRRKITGVYKVFFV